MWQESNSQCPIKKKRANVPIIFHFDTIKANFNVIGNNTIGNKTNITQAFWHWEEIVTNLKSEISNKYNVHLSQTYNYIFELSKLTEYFF